MNALSLFSGIGGIDLACEWAGIKTVAFCEREPFCQKVLRKHWPNVPIYDDVCTLTKARLDADGIEPIDLIHGGYPCQPFSYAGKRKGTEDDRHLWPEYFRLVQEIRPRWVVGENVAGHISLGLDDVLSDLESEGYEAIPIVLPACAVYASHRRDRVFIVGYTEHDGSHRATIGRGADKASNNHPKRADEAREPSGASGRSGDASLAHASGGQCNAGTEVKGILRALPADGTINRDTGGRGSAQSREDVADTTSKQNRRREQSRIQPDTGAISQDVADTDNERRQQRDVTAGSEGLGHHSRSVDAGGAYSARGAVKPGMGGSADEFSRWLDGSVVNPLDALADFISSYPQPALMGQPQYEWEPPRLATGVRNRSARLKALGNAVDPLQIFPIMYAIKIIDDWVMSQ